MDVSDDVIRVLVEDILREGSGGRPTSAGFVLFRRFKGVLHVLGLRRFSQFDLPKGHIESGESDLSAARRETNEEAGVSEIDTPWGEESVRLALPKKDVVLFVGITDQDPVIRRNPETSRFEHHGFKWIHADDVDLQSFGRLAPGIEWALQLVRNSEQG